MTYRRSPPPRRTCRPPTLDPHPKPDLLDRRGVYKWSGEWIVRVLIPADTARKPDSGRFYHGVRFQHQRPIDIYSEWHIAQANKPEMNPWDNICLRIINNLSSAFIYEELCSNLIFFFCLSSLNAKPGRSYLVSGGFCWYLTNNINVIIIIFGKKGLDVHNFRGNRVHDFAQLCTTRHILANGQITTILQNYAMCQISPPCSPPPTRWWGQWIPWNPIPHDWANYRWETHLSGWLWNGPKIN